MTIITPNDGNSGCYPDLSLSHMFAIGYWLHSNQVIGSGTLQLLPATLSRNIFLSYVHMNYIGTLFSVRKRYPTTYIPNFPTIG